MYSERRLGKTSLIKKVLSELDSKKYVSCYIDLWTTESELAFSKVYAKGLADAFSGTAQELLDTAKKLFSQLLPSLVLSSSGEAQLSFQLTAATETLDDIEALLQVPEEQAKRHKKTCVVVFDEFQEILKYQDSRLLKKLRSVIQNQEHVAYVFLGSKKHWMQDIFLNKSQPFYRAGTHYPLESIKEEDWRSFLIRQFKKKGIQMGRGEVRQIISITEGHPFYTQHLCHELWNICEESLDDEHIQTALRTLLNRESYYFEAVWDNLTHNQKKLLFTLSRPNPPESLHSKAFLQKYDYASNSSVQRVLIQLSEKGIIDKQGEDYYICDPFLKRWIQDRIDVLP